MNNSWGFNMKDDKYKSVNELIHYLVNAAGRNANFLLNVGPMPNGKIQDEFTDTLKEVGKWMVQYGESIYNTRANLMPPQDWGVVTSNDKAVYVHVLKKPAEPIVLKGITGKVKSCEIMGSNQRIKFKQSKTQVTLNPDEILWDNIDTIIKIQTI